MNMQLFSQFSWNNLLSKIKSFTVEYQSKETYLLWDNCLKDIGWVNGLETFSIDIKTIERVKKKTIFQIKMADFNGR